MDERQPETMLSPLDQIRQAEAEVTRRLAAVREAAALRVEEAHKQAANLKSAAWELGMREGQARYRAIIQQAEEEASEIVAQAQLRCERLRRQGEQRMPEAVALVVNLVIGVERKENGA